MLSSWQAPGSYRFAQLLDGQQIRSQCLAVGELYGTITAFRIEKIEKARRPTAICVFVDVPRLLRLIEVAGAVESHNLVVAAPIFKRVLHVGQHLPLRELLLLLCLRHRVSGARDLTLVAIENR